MPKITLHGGSTPPVTDEEKAAQQEPADDVLEASPEPSGGKPAVNDAKAAWVDYAIVQGWSREDAEAATKADLVEKLKG